MDLNLCSVFDDALNAVKQSDTTVPSFRNAFNYDPSKTATTGGCDAFKTRADAANAVKGPRAASTIR
jgi:hypothetical protein